MNNEIQCGICKRNLKQQEKYTFVHVKEGTLGNETYVDSFMSIIICKKCISNGLEIFKSKEGFLKIKINE